jgi:hypothetical protein
MRFWFVSIFTHQWLKSFAHSGISTTKYYLKPSAVAYGGRFITAGVNSMKWYAARWPASTDEMKWTCPQLKLLSQCQGLLAWYLGTFAKLRKPTISFFMSGCPCFYPSACNNSAPTRLIFVESGIWGFFENLSRKLKFRWNLSRITGALHDRCTVMKISRWILLRMRSVWDKSCRENQNTHFMFSSLFFPRRKLCRLWKKCGENVVEPDIPHDDMAHAHCMPDNLRPQTHTISSTYCLSMQQWLRERASLLRWHCLVCTSSSYPPILPANHPSILPHT